MSSFDKLQRHIGKHLDSFDTLTEEFLDECFTRSTRDAATLGDGLIEHWEVELGIDDPAVALADRQAQLNAKLRAVGGDNLAYFKNVAEGLGYNIDSATDPHLRITEGDFPPPRADYAQADVSKVWDQDIGSTMYTWCVRGTGVETDTLLQEIFNNHKAEGTEVIYINE